MTVDGWNPIYTVPEDGFSCDNRVDIWVVTAYTFSGSTSSPKVESYRVPDCRTQYKNPDTWIDSDGKYVNGVTYWFDGDECFDSGNNPVIPEKAVVRRRTIVTHWRPKPAQPIVEPASLTDLVNSLFILERVND